MSLQAGEVAVNEGGTGRGRPVVAIQHLRKVYRNLVAVADLNLELEAGDIFGFIGPNGAGKTTTIKMLATLLLPTGGTATIDGVDITAHPDAVRAVVGYMPDFFGVYDDIKVWEYLDFFAAAYRIPKARRPRVIADVLELTDLTVKKEAYVESLSRGMKQRLCLAKTLVHDPKVLLLDEPASGLDPRARIEIKELLKELRAMGKTIIVSSHILPELADFCNKVGIIEKGRMVIAGEVNEIVRHIGGRHTLEVRVRPTDAGADPEAVGGSDGALARAVDLLHAHADIEEVRLREDIIMAVYGGDPAEEWRVLKHLVEHDVKVLSFTTQETDLEDVFMSVTRGLVS